MVGNGAAVEVASAVGDAVAMAVHVAAGSEAVGALVGDGSGVDEPIAVIDAVAVAVAVPPPSSAGTSNPTARPGPHAPSSPRAVTTA